MAVYYEDDGREEQVFRPSEALRMTEHLNAALAHWTAEARKASCHAFKNWAGEACKAGASKAHAWTTSPATAGRQGYALADGTTVIDLL